MIRISVPNIDDTDIESVSSIIKTGFLVQGKNVLEFEEVISKYLGVKYAVAVSNCTAALHISLIASDVQPNDIVLVPTFSWLSTANVVELCGALPVFVDIKPDTFNMDPVKLEETLAKLSKNSKTKSRLKAVIPVHTFGNPADIDLLRKIARKYKIKLIEDAACALGAELNGKKIGSFGDMACFSFHPRKAVTTGEGGIITTDNSRTERHLRALRNHGLDPSAGKPEFIMAGFNYRLTEFQAGFGVSQMKKLEAIIKIRKEKADFYKTALDGTGILPPYHYTESKHVYQTYTVLIPKGTSRDELILNMKAAGIETNIGTYYMPMTKFFKKKYSFKESDFPVSADISKRTLALPMHEFLTEDDQKKTVSVLLEQIERLSKKRKRP